MNKKYIIGYFYHGVGVGESGQMGGGGDELP